MITCRFRGRTANTMFQAAAVIAHALKNETSYAFPTTSGKWNQFIFEFQANFPTVDSTYLNETLIYREEKFGKYNPIPNEKNLCLQGYFQSEKYFREYKDQIIPLFKIPNYDFVPPNTVSIHVRRGDYLAWTHKYPQPPLKYWYDAIDHFPKAEGFLVFSDDIDWCRKNFMGSKFVFTEDPRGAKTDLGLMSSCAHHIIMNSTFGWWGAYLGKNPNKQVIVPHEDHWFGVKYKDRLSAEDIIPETWTRLKY